MSIDDVLSCISSYSPDTYSSLKLCLVALRRLEADVSSVVLLLYSCEFRKPFRLAQLAGLLL